MNDLKPGTYFVLENAPYVVLEAKHVKMAQGRPVMQTKIKNLLTGNVLNRNFHQSDTFEETELEKLKVKYLYAHRAQYWFSDTNNPTNRFSLSQATLGPQVGFLKPNLELEALSFEGKIISVNLPIKVDLKVVEAPPAIRGSTAQGGTKTVILETGASLNTPLFINTGDVIRINTQTGEYVERVSKG